MKDFLRHFKLPLILTPVVLVLAVIVGVALALQFQGGDIQKRSAMLGQGVAIASMILIAPFWIYSAARFGKERRAALEKAKAKKAKPRRKQDD